MKQTKDNTETVNSSKKTKAQIAETLATALASLLPILGKKKFNKRIKKAGKILSRNVNGTAKINERNVAKKNPKTQHIEQ